MATTNNNKNYIPVAIIAIVALVALVFLMQKPRENDSPVAAAIEDIGDNIEDAGRDMDPHRSTGERIGDAIDDAGDSIDEATDGDGR